MKNILLLICVSCVPLLAQSGYSVYTTFQVRACATGCDQPDCGGCSSYAQESFLSWNEEENIALEARLSEQLRKHLEQFQHWHFFTGEEISVPVSVRVSIEDDVGGIRLVLKIKTPLEFAPVEVRGQALYPPGHFQSTTIYPLEREEQNLTEALARLFSKSHLTNIEEHLKTHIPICRTSKWVNPESGQLVVPLARDRFDYLGKARFKVRVNSGELISDSNCEWQGAETETSLAVVAKTMATKDLGGSAETSFESLTEEQRQALQLGAVFLVSFQKCNTFGVF